MILRCNLLGCRLCVVEDLREGSELTTSRAIVESIFGAEEGRIQASNYKHAVLPVSDMPDIGAYLSISALARR